MQRTPPRSIARAGAAASLALAVACAAVRQDQREAPAALEDGAPPLAAATLAAPPLPERAPARPPADPVERALSAAREDLGKRGGRGGIDCSTFVREAFLAAGIDLMADASPGDNGVRAIQRYVRRHGRLHRRRLPAPGDLVFFHNSYDRNGNRRLDDRLTHLGIVEQVLPDGTALVLHATNHGVVREPMNLLRPHDTSDGAGRAINAVLRRRSSGDSRRTPRLMSELFAGFGTVAGEAPQAPQPAARRPLRAARLR